MLIPDFVLLTFLDGHTRALSRGSFGQTEVGGNCYEQQEKESLNHGGKIGNNEDK